MYTRTYIVSFFSCTPSPPSPRCALGRAHKNSRLTTCVRLPTSAYRTTRKITSPLLTGRFSKPGFSTTGRAWTRRASDASAQPSSTKSFQSHQFRCVCVSSTFWRKPGPKIVPGGVFPRVYTVLLLYYNTSTLIMMATPLGAGAQVGGSASQRVPKSQNWFFFPRFRMRAATWYDL